MSEEHNPTPTHTRAGSAEEPPRTTAQDLHHILNRGVTLDTSIDDFLLIAGWYGYHCSQIYTSADEGMRQRIDAYAHAEAKRQNLRHVDVRFWNSLQAYNQRGGNVRTLGDLQTLLEEQGNHIKNLGYRTFAHLNVALQEHGIHPFRVRPYPDTPYSLRQLRKAGLEPA